MSGSNHTESTLILDLIINLSPHCIILCTIELSLTLERILMDVIRVPKQISPLSQL